MKDKKQMTKTNIAYYAFSILALILLLLNYFLFG